MDKIRLNEILEMDDAIVSMQDLVVMDRLATKYPYCSVFKVLAAKFAYIVKSFNKEQWLHLAGVYVSDREHLKNVLSNIGKPKLQSAKTKSSFVKQDIISAINSYHDEQLSDNPTKQELLDKFLKIENPKPQLSSEGENASDHNIDKAIKQSAKSDFKIVTETMAKIYAKQGSKAKAIQIYQQLMESQPQKEAYYMNQIEILKNS